MAIVATLKQEMHDHHCHTNMVKVWPLMMAIASDNGGVAIVAIWRQSIVVIVATLLLCCCHFVALHQQW